MPIPVDPNAYEKYQAAQDIIRKEWALHDKNSVMHWEANKLVERAAELLRAANIREPYGQYELTVEVKDSALHLGVLKTHVEVSQQGPKIVTNDGTTCAEWDDEAAEFVGVEEGASALDSLLEIAAKEVLGGRKRRF
jgi:hypothetical protein